VILNVLVGLVRINNQIILKLNGHLSKLIDPFNYFLKNKILFCRVLILIKKII
jgi:hypothetical protein